MANLRTNKLVGIGSTDAGVVFDGPIKINTQGVMYFPTGDTSQRGRGVGLYAGGATPSATAQIASIQIQSTGDVVDWGDLSVARFAPGSGASSTRGVWSGGATPTRLNTIDYVTIATTGTAKDFGDATTLKYVPAGASNSTRFLNAGGNTSPGGAMTNTIDLTTIATVGNATDFGDLNATTAGLPGGASTTRAVWAGGWTDEPGYTTINTIQYVTIATTGNTSDFGDMTIARKWHAGGSSQTRMVMMGGYGSASPGWTELNTIDFVEIATTGNATDFGDITVGVADRGAMMSNSIRGVAAGGYISPAATNHIHYVTIATTGNAADFGDCVQAVYSACGLSDSHGGLS